MILLCRSAAKANEARKCVSIVLRALDVRPVREGQSNASPDTAALFLDAGIIGLPPREDYAGPRLYAAGPSAGALALLNQYGLNVCPLEGAIGTASALKMAYAGIAKGLITAAAAMILNAGRAGVAGVLRQELAASAPALFASPSRSVPDMLPKAYRWVDRRGTS